MNTQVDGLEKSFQISQRIGWRRQAMGLLRELAEEVETLRSERTAWRITAENAEAAQSLPDGWKLVAVKGLGPLVSDLERAESKGYMPFALEESWAEFDYQNVAASPAQPVQPSEQAFDEAAERSGAERGYELRVRRVSERNEHEKMMYALGWWDRAWASTTHPGAQAKPEQAAQPLTTKQINELSVWPLMKLEEVVRVVEAAHGIAASQTKD